MSTTYAIYNTTSGRISSYGSTNEAVTGLGVTGEAGIVATGVISDLTHYVPPTGAPAITARPANPSVLATGDGTIAADGVDEANLSSIPTGSTYAISGPITSTGAVTGGALAFTTDVAGVYTIEIFSFPNVDAVFEVTAT
jgi:hypothetical protein